MHNSGNQKGFTIVELMIATSVLAIILLITTLIMTSIGALYTKGVNQSKVQDSARSLLDSLAQDIQLSNGSVTAGTDSNGHYLCVNNVRYSYVMGRQLNTAGNMHTLWRDIAPSPCTSAAPLGNASLDSISPGTEMIPDRSRLTRLCITSSNGSCDPSGVGPYTIEVGVVYGDSELLCNADSAYGSECSSTGANHINVENADIRCRSQVGSQFCATATLATTVTTRLNGVE